MIRKTVELKIITAVGRVTAIRLAEDDFVRITSVIRIYLDSDLEGDIQIASSTYPGEVGKLVAKVDHFNPENVH